jgi:hypothetical protein|tara:strand:+ start:998 stop:2467 length:1470 start_codon:yes stop_codon:yes gene_type:complete
MDVDWGGQGPASMPTGSTCGDLGTDKCAGITGSGSSTSTMGVAGMGTTFIQTIDVQNINMEGNGGRVTYTIKVDKQDSADSIYMHLTGKDGSTTAFAGTDFLSAAGVASGYAEYTGGFDFGGSLTSIIVEIGGRDINLSIGPVFDDVTIGVLYNIINTIISMQITTIETFIALGVYDEEAIGIAEDIFDNNDFTVDPNGGINVEPIFDDATSGGDTYETVDMELDMDFNTGPITSVEVTMEDSIEMDMEFEMEMPDVSEPEGTDLPPPDMDKPPPEEIEMASANMASDEMPEMENMADEEPSTETEMEPSKPETEPEPQEDIQNEPEPDAEEPEPEVEAKPEKPKEEEPQKKAAEEEEKEPEVKVAAKEEPKEKEQEKVEAKPKEEPKKTKAQQKQEQKQKAGSKIVAKMGDKGRYDADNQIKTLLVMQVLGNTKTFFESQKTLKDTQGFFSDLAVPDNSISDNNYASFIMFGGSNVKMDALIDMQYKN